LFILDVISTELALQTTNIYGFSLQESNWLMKPVVENLLASYGLKFVFFILILLICEQSIEFVKKRYGSHQITAIFIVIGLFFLDFIYLKIVVNNLFLIINSIISLIA